jgi:peptidoglycan/xylan/chitin deacetylase (PgdA/CDA1 family)
MHLLMGTKPGRPAMIAAETIPESGTAVPADVRTDDRLCGRLWGLGQQCLLRALVPVATALGNRHQAAFGILVYHRVTQPTAGIPVPTNNVTPHTFRRQLAGLLRRGYQAWPLRKALEYHRQGRPIPRETFVVTFDDGYASVYQHAVPILRELQIPATVFVATAYLDAEWPFPFDDWSANVRPEVHPLSWRPLSTRECAEMIADGLIDLGTHTHWHADFRGRPALLYRDLLTSLAVLRARFGVKDATFAFPFGNKERGFCAPELSAAAQGSGVLCSLTTEQELVTPQQPPFDWGRFTVTSCDTAATLVARLSGWYTLFRDLWRRLRRASPSRQGAT